MRNRLRKIVKEEAPKIEQVKEEPEQNAFLSFVSGTKTLACLCFLISLLLYVNTLGHEFTFDDNAAVVFNPAVTGDAPFYELIARDFWGTPTSSSLSHKSYRPLTSLLFRILWFIRGGKDRPFLFHLTLVLGNAFASALAVVVVLKECDALVKVVAAVLYAVHPIKTEAVAGIVGTAEMLSACFVFAAFYLYKRKTNPFLVGYVFFVAGLAKETGVFASFIVLVYAFQKREKAYGLEVVFTAFGFFFFARYLAFGTDWAIEPSPQDNPLMKMKGIHWLLNVVHVQTKYLEILFFPRVLSCDYSFNAMPMIKSFKEPYTLACMSATLLVFFLIWRAFWKNDVPLRAGLLWYIAPMIPATHLIGIIGTVVAERLMYVPLIGWSMLIGEACRRLRKKVGLTVIFMALVLTSAGLGARTVIRNRDWESNPVLFNRTLEDAPNSIKAIMNVANAHFSDRNVEQLKKLVSRALKVDPQFCQSYHLLGKAFLEIKKDYARALKYLTKCHDCMIVKRHSSQVLAEVFEMMGSCQFGLNNITGSLPFYQEALKLGYEDASCNLSVGMQKLKRWKEALPFSEMCIRAGLQSYRLHSPFARTQASLKLRNHAILLSEIGRFDDALATFKKSSELDPSQTKKNEDYIKAYVTQEKANREKNKKKN